MNTVRWALHASRLFEGIEPEQFEAVLAGVQTQALAPGELVFRHGDVGDATYVLMEGELQVFVTTGDGSTLLLNKLRPAEHFGEQALLPGGDGLRSASVRAATPAVVARIDRALFERTLGDNRPLKERLRHLSDDHRRNNLVHTESFVYRPLPPGQLRRVDRVAFPHHLETAFGHWIHMAVVESVKVPDPFHLGGRDMIMQQQHSVIICNPELNDVVDLRQIPMTELAKRKPDGFVPLRIHSLCRFGDVFGSLKCDCGPQLMVATRTIMREGSGMIIYTEQEGRNAGLFAKSAFYRMMEVDGVPTSETFQLLGLEKSDLRDYDAALDVLDLLGVDKVEFLSNNPSKIGSLKAGGREVRVRPVHIPTTAYDEAYLSDKRGSMGHMLPTDLHVISDNPDVRAVHLLRNLMPHLEAEHLEALALKIAEEKNLPELRAVVEGLNAGRGA